MALLPSTPATRSVPVAGRQFAERRLIRGVGAAERSVGHAWGRMTSRQREYYGNQKNFAGGLQRESNRRKADDEENEDNAQQDQGRQDAMGDAPPAAAEAAPPKPPTNHAREVMQTSEEAYAERMGNRRRSDMARMKVENPDRYERINAALEVDKGVPRERPGWQDKPDMDDAIIKRRVIDPTNALAVNTDNETTAAVERGFDQPNYTVPEDPAFARSVRLKAKGYQMESRRRFSDRGQKPLRTGISY